MEIKLAKSIDAEINKEKEVKIYLQDNGNKEFETVKDLLEQINYDLKWSKDNNVEEEFLNSKVVLNLSDIEGQVIEGKLSLSVGYLENGCFLLTGNIDNVSFIKEDNNK